MCLAAAASTRRRGGARHPRDAPGGREFLPLSRTLVNIGQTFPPVAVLAVAVPLVGFGEKPTLIALFAYGLLPIFENTHRRPADLSAGGARGGERHGHERPAAAVSVELPLAMPLILEGIRLSLVINVGTATIGSTVAAKGLGEVIIAGLLSNNTAFILQGGLVTGAHGDPALRRHGGPRAAGAARRAASSETRLAESASWPHRNAVPIESEAKLFC